MRIVPLLLLMLLTACSHTDLARRVVEPPNKGHPERTLVFPEPGAIPLTIPVGPPDATIAAWVLEPPTQPPRDTILLLHGIIANHDQVKNTAAALRNAGFRTVAIDLRGHGRSSGDHISYGVFESRDLSQITDYLQQHHLAGPTIGVYGNSYGAATAIQFAALDPRVKAVVAVAPFSTLHNLAPHFARTVVPIPGAFLTDPEIHAIVDQAAALAGFNASDASPLAAIQKISTPVLLIHGTDDAVNPFSHSVDLHNAAPAHSQLIPLAGEGHLALSFELNPTVISQTTTFFDTHLPTSAASAKVSAPSSKPPL